MKKQTYFTLEDLIDLIFEPDFQEIIKYAEKLEYNDKAKAYKVTYEDGKDVEAQTEFYYKKTLKVPPRSVVILVAE